MPRIEQVLSVFVASPNDVSDEREKLEEVVHELNLTWSRELGVRLDLVRWETHAFPGIGADAQDVINQQIPDDYDLFVGLMWCRSGTPTTRAGSGTAEEFARAKARYDANPNSVKLMMYFEDAPIPPSQLEPMQLAEVNRFRESLGVAGGLYWNFNEINQFEQLIRLHLTRQVQTWNTRPQELTEVPPQTPAVLRSEEGLITIFAENDLGLLDYAEIFEERSEELNSIIAQISRSIEELGTKMTERASEMKALPRDSQGSANRKDARRLISRAATDLELFAPKISSELPLFSSAMDFGMTALTRFIMLSTDLRTDKNATQQTEEALGSIVNLRTALVGSMQSIHYLQEKIATLPRMTRELNQAKRKAASVLDELLEVLRVGNTLLQEAEAATRGVLNDETDTIRV